MIGAQCNRKTVTQLMREAEELQTIERERANARMLAGKALDPMPTLAQGSKGKTRDKVAEAVGKSIDPTPTLAEGRKGQLPLPANCRNRSLSPLSRLQGLRAAAHGENVAHGQQTPNGRWLF